MENYSQYLIITHKGKESEKERLTVHLRRTQQCNSLMPEFKNLIDVRGEKVSYRVFKPPSSVIGEIIRNQQDSV